MEEKAYISSSESPQCAKNNSFKCLPLGSPLIQVLHVSGCHWAVVSNVCRRKSVGYYDSAHPFTVGVNLREAVCSFYKSDAAFVHFDIVNVMEQPNPHDCGVLALANATELAHNCDPALCHWDVKCMREHLLLCLGRLNGFLLVGRGVFLLVYEYGRQ